MSLGCFASPTRMSDDWDDPTRSQRYAGLSRRQLLAGAAGSVAVVGGGLTLGSDVLDGETLLTVDREGLYAETINLGEGVPLAASITADSPGDAPAGVGVGVEHRSTKTVIMEAEGDQSASAKGRTETSGPHTVVFGAAGAYEGALRRRFELF